MDLPDNINGLLQHSKSAQSTNQRKDHGKKRLRGTRKWALGVHKHVMQQIGNSWPRNGAHVAD